MVKIIAGPINSGKTTALIDEYKKHGGDGFASVKIMEGDMVRGFDFMRLSTGERRPFIRRSGDEPEGWVENCTMGPYTFSEEAVRWVESVFAGLLADAMSPLYLDEVGMLEADGRCLYEAFVKILGSGIDICFTARDVNADKLTETFGIENPEVTMTGERYA